MDINGLVVGLGNPGAKYDGSRHNCGFMFIDDLLRLARVEGKLEELNAKKFSCLLWNISLPQLRGNWLAAEPLTFMNDSGLSVRPLLAWYKLLPDNLLVVHDELDIPPGEIRFKFGGGLAGHNGLASIAQHLGSKDFYRMRIGIGKPLHKENMIAWVLGRPPQTEAALLAKLMPEALETFFIFSNEGLMAAAQYARDVSRENKA